MLTDSLVQVPFCLLLVRVHGFRSIGIFFYDTQGMSKMNLVCAGILYAINAYLNERGMLPKKDACVGMRRLAIEDLEHMQDDSD